MTKKKEQSYLLNLIQYEQKATNWCNQWLPMIKRLYIKFWLMERWLNPFNFYLQPGRTTSQWCQGSNCKLITWSLGAVPLLRLYLVWWVEFFAWSLRHPKRRILTRPSIFWLALYVSIRVELLKIKRLCIKFWLIVKLVKYFRIPFACYFARQVNGWW